jgi:hypothetical protein
MPMPHTTTAKNTRSAVGATLVPADTRIMGVVHRALLRDLERADRLLAGPDPLPDQQRVAVAGHVSWMMGFLRAHHASEDDGLFPAVLARRPDVAGQLDRMDDDHRALGPAITDVETAAEAYNHAGPSSSQAVLLASLRRLHDPLAAHLRREEEVTMPIASACLSDDEWRAIEKEHNLEGKSFAELGFEGHWLIDGVTAEDRDVVLGVVPAIQRHLLVLGYSRSYRRRRVACWQGAPPARTVQQHGRVEVTVDAPIEAVRAVLHDITRQGEWSHECVKTEWLDGATATTVGAHFRGRNAQGVVRWGRTCEIVSSAPDELAWRTVPTMLYPDSTRWTIQLSPTPGGGTHIEQRFDAERGPKVLLLLYSFLIPAHRDRLEALHADLRRLGALAAEQ